MLAQVGNIILGLYLMVAPDILNYNGAAADNTHIVGPVVSSFAIIALSGCTRSVAKYNIPLGIWLMLSPLVITYGNEPAINSICAGVIITFFSFQMRKTTHQYGGGWMAVWKSTTP
jgi:hypothetical protein